jgi:hypothetical protein
MRAWGAAATGLAMASSSTGPTVATSSPPATTQPPADSVTPPTSDGKQSSTRQQGM